MLFSVGDRRGPYEIFAPVGDDGMDEVNFATDTRLHCEVAIKLKLAADPQEYPLPWLLRRRL